MLSFIPQSKENEKIADSGCKVSDKWQVRHELNKAPNFKTALFTQFIKYISISGNRKRKDSKWA